MTESTPQESADSIGADLLDAFAEVETNVEAAEAPENAENVTDAQIVEEEEIVESSETVEANSEESEEIEPLEPPQHWSAEDKEKFSTAPPEVQQFILDRHKAMEGDATKKWQEASEIRKAWQPIEQQFEPVMAELEKRGITPQQYVNNLLAADRMLAQDPVTGFMHLAQQYGIDLNQVVNQHNPETAELRKELAQLKAMQYQTQNNQAFDQRSKVMSEIESFAAEKTEAGELAHPYFDEVMGDLTTLAAAERAAGRTPVLKELYEKAVWANPVTREKLTAATLKAKRVAQERDAREKAAKAKKAGTAVKGGITPPPSAGLDLRDSLEASLNNWSGNL